MAWEYARIQTLDITDDHVYIWALQRFDGVGDDVNITDNVGSLNTVLHKAGLLGWEMVGVQHRYPEKGLTSKWNMVFYLKRVAK